VGRGIRRWDWLVALLGLVALVLGLVCKVGALVGGEAQTRFVFSSNRCLVQYVGSD